MTRAIRASAARELRALLPIWLMTIAAIAAGLVVRRLRIDNMLPMLAYAFGSVTVGAYAIGHEFSNRTLAMSLSQPIDRRMVLAIKLLVAAVLLAGLGAGAAQVVPSSRIDVGLRELIVVGLVALCVAPLLTMASRSVIAGVVFTIAVPAIAWLGLDSIGLALHSRARPGAIDAFRIAWFIPTLFTFCGLAAIATWVMFIRLEAIDGGGRAITLDGWRSTRRSGTLTRQHPLAALAAKELRIHQMAFVIAGLYVGLMLIQAVLLDPHVSTLAIAPLTILYAGALALLTGSLASAEERQFGTWQAHMLTPIAAWQQWLVKVAVAFGVVALLAGVVPWLLSFLLPVLQGRVSDYAQGIVWLSLLLAFSLFVSSLSSSGVRALLMSVGAAFAAGIAIRWLLLTLTFRSEWKGSLRLGHDWELEVLAVAWVLLIGLLLILAYRNHRVADRSARRIAGQIVVLALTVVSILTVLSALGI